MKPANRAYFLLFTAFLAGGCRPTKSDWNGTWHLDMAKSNFKGPEFIITNPELSEYRYDDGNSAFSISCDAKNHPMAAGRLQRCTRVRDTVLDIKRQENGKTVSTSQWELSSDGMILTLRTTTFREGLPAQVTQVTASRISKGHSFAGFWRDSEYLIKHADIELKVDEKALHLVYPLTAQNIEAPFNGSDGTISGPHAPPGLKYTARLAGERDIVITVKRDGKLLETSYLTMRDRGTSIAYSWSDPHRPAQEGVLVYERK